MSRRKSTDEFINKAKEVHGDKYSYVLSKYVNSKTKIKIICMSCKSKYNRLSKCTFYQSPDKHLNSKQGCPVCSTRKSEKYFGDILKKEFPKYKFKKTRPSFLKYKNGYNLELDFYCKELGIAFEINGSQHYKYNKFFHKNIKDFINQVRRDNFKQEMCDQENIKLYCFDLRRTYGKSKLKIFKDFINLKMIDVI